MQVVENGVVSLEMLFQEAVERNYRGNANTVVAVISQESCRTVWDTFTQWSQQQVDSGNSVYVKYFGIIGYDEPLPPTRILHIELLENFLM